MRGADTAPTVAASLMRGLSPRARGRHVYAGDPGVLLRTIPACAGPTLVDLGFYPANERFSFSLTQSG